MAASMYNIAKQREATVGLGFADAGKSFRLLLATGNTANFSAAHTTLAQALAVNPELNAGNGNTNGYQAGFGGAGRKTLPGDQVTVTVDNAGNRVVITLAQQSWSGITAAAGTVTAALLALQPAGAAGDGDLVPYLFLPLSTPQTPNGTTFILSPDAANGLWQIL